MCKFFTTIDQRVFSFIVYKGLKFNISHWAANQLYEQLSIHLCITSHLNERTVAFLLIHQLQRKVTHFGFSFSLTSYMYFFIGWQFVVILNWKQEIYCMTIVKPSLHSIQGRKKLCVVLLKGILWNAQIISNCYIIAEVSLCYSCNKG